MDAIRPVAKHEAVAAISANLARFYTHEFLHETTISGLRGVAFAHPVEILIVQIARAG